MTNGLHDLERQLRRIARNAESLQDPTSVPFDELFPDDFVRRNAPFGSMQAMLDAGGVQSESDLEGASWDRFVREQTRFAGWKEMMEAAAGEWIVRRIGL